MTNDKKLKEEQHSKNESVFSLVTVKLDNIEKTIFKFELKKNGDVFLYNRHAQFFRLSGTKDDNAKEIKQQRYSFHKSSESKEGINFIKQTLDIGQSDMINTYIVTPVIKKNAGFIHVFSSRSPDMSPERYNSKIKKNYRVMSIGDCDVKSSTLFYSLFVGSSKIQFPKKITTANALSFTIGDFRFLFTWAYLPMPSHYTGNLIHSGTIKTNSGDILGQTEGLNTSEAIKLSHHYFNCLINEYDATLNSCEDFPNNFVIELFKSTGFLKDGSESSLERSKLYMRLYASGKVNKYDLD